jgi:hypothetical protein
MTSSLEFYNRRKGFNVPKASGPLAVKIEHRVGVHAPASLVWDMIQDLQAWPDWNPVYPKASGVVRIGEKLSFTRALPGQPHEQVEATVQDWTPNELLHVKRSAYGGLFSATAYWEIDVLAEESCIFSAGELYTGFLGRRRARAMRRALRRGFEAEAEALKVRAEAAWQARAPQPTSGA